jgi:hypothetical protein
VLMLPATAFRASTTCTHTADTQQTHSRRSRTYNGWMCQALQSCSVILASALVDLHAQISQLLVA